MSDDPTKSLPDEKYATMPGLTAILERINQVRDELMAKLTEVETRVKVVEEQGRLTNHKFDILIKDVFEYKAMARETQARIDELERKAL